MNSVTCALDGVVRRWVVWDFLYLEYVDASLLAVEN